MTSFGCIKLSESQRHKAFDSSEEGYDGLLVGVVYLCGSGGAFAATKLDGSVVTWGDPACGGDSRKVAQQLKGVVSALWIASACGEKDLRCPTQPEHLLR